MVQQNDRKVRDLKRPKHNKLFVFGGEQIKSERNFSRSKKSNSRQKCPLKMIKKQQIPCWFLFVCIRKRKLTEVINPHYPPLHPAG